MAFIDDLTALLVDQGLGSIGTSIFKWYVPDVPGTSITVTPVDGEAPDPKFAYDNPAVQVRVRGADSDDVADVAQRIFALLQSFHGGPLITGGLHVVDIQCLQSSPVYMGRDALGRDNLVMNFQARVRSPEPGNRV